VASRRRRAPHKWGGAGSPFSTAPVERPGTDSGEKTAAFSSHWHFGLENLHPPHMGVIRKSSKRVEIEQSNEFSTFDPGYPQFFAGYPQFSAPGGSSAGFAPVWTTPHRWKVIWVSPPLDICSNRRIIIFTRLNMMTRKITPPILAAQAEIFKLLSHPCRLAILYTLRSGEECVCHMEATLGYRQAYLSQQLAVLRQAGIIQAGESTTASSARRFTPSSMQSTPWWAARRMHPRGASPQQPAPAPNVHPAGSKPDPASFSLLTEVFPC